MADRQSYLKLKRAHENCLLCGKPLSGAKRHPSVLEVSERDEAIRRDFCADCWKSSTDQQYFGFWLTRRLETGPTARERRLARADRNEALWRLFAALHALENAEHAPQLFFLAHLLMRYKVLSFAGVAPDGMLLFEHAHVPDAFRIAEVPLDSVSFAEVRKSVEAQAAQLAAESGTDTLADLES